MLTSFVILVTLIIAFWPSSSTVEPTVVARAPAGPRSGSPTGSGKSVANNDAAVRGASPDQTGDYMKTIQELKDAGNWIAVVPQALAWTRKEPGNAAAWNELSIAYANMRQLQDAHAAARMAVEFAPRNVLFWRNLGHLSLDLDAPVEALLAFEEATRLNNKDAYSFVQIGILETRLDHLPEAKLAFNSALALNPKDVNARCGATFVAQREARPNESNASTKQAKLANGVCQDLIDQASKAAGLSGPATFKDVPSQGR